MVVSADSGVVVVIWTEIDVVVVWADIDVVVDGIPVTG
jgi:hypothetical protein